MVSLASCCATKSYTSSEKLQNESNKFELNVEKNEICIINTVSHWRMSKRIILIQGHNHLNWKYELENKRIFYKVFILVAKDIYILHHIVPS